MWGTKCTTFLMYPVYVFIKNIGTNNITEWQCMAEHIEVHTDLFVKMPLLSLAVIIFLLQWWCEMHEYNCPSSTVLLLIISIMHLSMWKKLLNVIWYNIHVLEMY